MNDEVLEIVLPSEKFFPLIDKLIRILREYKEDEGIAEIRTVAEIMLLLEDYGVAIQHRNS